MTNAKTLPSDLKNLAKDIGDLNSSESKLSYHQAEMGVKLKEVLLWRGVGQT
jgi:hypothetical protein